MAVTLPYGNILNGSPEDREKLVSPSFLDVGVFAAGPEPNRVAFPLHASAWLKLSHDLRGVELSAEALAPGLNQTFLTIRDIEDSRTLYGFITASRPGGSVRKIYIYGQARANFPPRQLPPGYPDKRSGLFIAGRGERRDGLPHVLRIRLTPCVPKEFEIEPFAFLLNGKGRTRLGKNGKGRDEDLIFFNHDGSGADGSPPVPGIRLERVADKGEIFLELDSLDPDIQRVTIAFSIWKEGFFNQLQDYSVLIEGERPEEFTGILPLDNLGAVKNLIALEIRRRANARDWRVSFRKEEYPNEIAQLCQHYGLEVKNSDAVD